MAVGEAGGCFRRSPRGIWLGNGQWGPLQVGLALSRIPDNDALCKSRCGESLGAQVRQEHLDEHCVPPNNGWAYVEQADSHRCRQWPAQSEGGGAG